MKRRSIKPLDLVRTIAGDICMVTAVSDHAPFNCSLRHLRFQEIKDYKVAWYGQGELTLLDSIPALLADGMQTHGTCGAGERHFPLVTEDK